MNSKQRLLNRVYIMSNLDYIIKESIYHRTHSDEFQQYDPLSIGSINDQELKVKIL